MAKENSNHRTPDAQEISSFCSQITMMLQAGIPLADGIDMLAKDDKEQVDELYAPVSAAMNNGESLYDALRQDGRWPQYMVEMTGIGEETGHLETVMQGLSEYYAREYKVHTAIRHAVAYPLLLGGLLLVIVFVMLWKVVPLFRHVLSSMGIGEGGAASRVMNLGSSVGWITLAILGVLLLGIAVCLVLLKTRAGANLKKMFLQRVPWLRRIIHAMSVARISSVLSMTLSSGYPVSSVKEMVALILEDENAKEAVDTAAANSEMGTSFVNELANGNLYEPLHRRMLRVAVAAGNDGDTLKYLADLYEEKAEDELSRLLSIVEPTIVVILSIVIGAILLSVMLPMASLLTGLV